MTIIGNHVSPVVDKMYNHADRLKDKIIDQISQIIDQVSRTTSCRQDG